VIVGEAGVYGYVSPHCSGLALGDGEMCLHSP